MRPSFFRKLLHPLCLLGAVFVAIGFGASVFSLVIDITSETGSAYQGLLTFVLYPSVLFFGLFLMTWGFFLEFRRARKMRDTDEEWRPRLDPATRKHRLILGGLTLCAATIVISSIIGAFHAYEFTESTEFCGELCHTPMQPQHTAHQFSPHANLECTTCHVASGIAGYIEAKMSGMRQLMQMLGATYPRPIVATHDKVEIAGQSCEHCHRPDKFWGAQLDSRTRFGFDLRNTEHPLHLLMKPAGLTQLPRAGQGIHWHMSVEGKIWFRAADDRRQSIPTVRVERPDGTMVVYKDPEWTPRSGELLPEQKMECIDCHSRPAHQFRTPDDMVNRALAADLIDRSIPSIKKVGVTALAKAYETAEAARSGIRDHVESFYHDHFQGSVLKRRESLEGAIVELQSMFERNSFPGMKVDWTSHPNNLGHRESAGCFRCHSGRHVSAEGELLTSSCDTCHVFFRKARGTENLTEIPVNDATYHPFAHEAHDKIDCWSCHTGAASPYASCSQCHDHVGKGHAMDFACSVCHKPGELLAQSDTCVACHPVGDSLMHAHKDHQDCLACHRAHTWQVDLTQSCGTCHKDQGLETWQKQLPAFAGVGATMGGLPVGSKN